LTYCIIKRPFDRVKYDVSSSGSRPWAKRGGGRFCIACPTDSSSFCDFLLFLPKIRRHPGPPGPSPWPLVSTGLVLLCHAMLTCHVTGVNLEAGGDGVDSLDCETIWNNWECYERNLGKLSGQVFHYNLYSLTLPVKGFQLGFNSQIATFWEHAPLILKPQSTFPLPALINSGSAPETDLIVRRKFF